MRGQRERLRRPTLLQAGLHLVRVAAAAILVFVVARAAYYPFWAASTDSEELARSWGGPSPTAATLAHWAVAALVGSVCVAVVVLSTRLMRPHR